MKKMLNKVSLVLVLVCSLFAGVNMADAAKNDDVCISLGGLLGERKAVTDEVSALLNLRALVVMRHDDGILFFRQSADLLLYSHDYKISFNISLTVGWGNTTCRNSGTV